MWTRRRVLGLAVTCRSLTAVEIDGGNERPRAVRAAEFTFPEGLGPNEPATLGKALKEFLRQRGFSASRCVVGMEAKWLTARRKVLPPGSGEAITDILRLMVEREFTSDSQELLADYAGPGGPQKAQQVVLFAAARSHVDQLVTMVQEAGPKPAAITSSTVALAQAVVPSQAPRRLVLNTSSGGMEVAVISQDAPPIVRRLSGVTPVEPGSDARPKLLSHLTAELRRIISLLPDDGNPSQPLELVIPTGLGIGAAEAEALASRLSLPLRTITLPDHLDAGDALVGENAGTYAAAASLALAALPGNGPVFDLLHSRLTPSRKKALGPKTFWAGAAVAGALVAFALLLLLAWQGDLNEIRDIEGRLAGMSQNLQRAREVVERTSLARQWYRRRPKFLECMRELTLAFPAEGAIWSTSLAIEEDMRVVFSGKAASEVAVLEVLDRLKASSRFADVKPLYLRESGRSHREVAFAMSCRFLGGE